MNFLAHFHLAWPEEMLVVGGLEGDFHKGLLPGELPPALLAGVTLHRAIDAYTDSHPVVAEVRRLFPNELRRYAGIVIDLCFDHFLANHWQDYSAIPRQRFVTAVYQLLEQHNKLLSNDAALLAARLQQYDVLSRYQHWETITGTATRIGQRLRHPNPLAATDALISPLLPELERAFRIFYPQLIRFARHGDMLGNSTDEPPV